MIHFSYGDVVIVVFFSFCQFTKGLQETHANGSSRAGSGRQESAGCHRPITTQDDQDLIKSEELPTRRRKVYFDGYQMK